MTKAKPPCRLCRCDWHEDMEWRDEYCRDCFRQLEGFSASQDGVIKKLMSRIEALEKPNQNTQGGYDRKVDQW